MILSYIVALRVVQLDVAKACGADVVLNPNKCDIVAEVKKMTDDYGCDVYIEATGHPASVVQGSASMSFHFSSQHVDQCTCLIEYSLHMIAKLGTFVEYSVFGQETTVDWTIISDMKGNHQFNCNTHISTGKHCCRTYCSWWPPQ